MISVEPLVSQCLKVLIVLSWLRRQGSPVPGKRARQGRCVASLKEFQNIADEGGKFYGGWEIKAKVIASHSNIPMKIFIFLHRSLLLCKK